MPGCGKSTIGVLTAKILGYDFLDTDLLVQQRGGKRLQEIIDSEGLETFRQIEESVLLSVNAKNTLIATGGSAIYYPRAMRHLSSIGTVAYLRAPLPVICDHLRDFRKRGIAMPGGMTIEALLRERSPLYERYADLTVDVTASEIAENMEKLVAVYQSFRNQ